MLEELRKRAEDFSPRKTYRHNMLVCSRCNTIPQHMAIGTCQHSDCTHGRNLYTQNHKGKYSMKINVMSDLHLEFTKGKNFPKTNGDILVLAGDIGLAVDPSTYMPFLKYSAEHYNHVIYVLGNHEHYHGDINDSIHNIRDSTINLSNVHVLENQSLVIGDTKFIGCTLWSDFKNDARCMGRVSYAMNDYRLISNRHGWYTPADALKLHNDSVHFLTNAIDSNKKNIVVTHMAPSINSIPLRFLQSHEIATAFYSSLEEFIVDFEPTLWLHGHVHNSNKYVVGNTTVISNPKGYPDAVNPEFNPTTEIEI